MSLVRIVGTDGDLKELRLYLRLPVGASKLPEAFFVPTLVSASIMSSSRGAPIDNRQRQDSMVSDSRMSPKMESPLNIAETPKPKTLSRVPSKFWHNNYISIRFLLLTNHSGACVCSSLPRGSRLSVVPRYSFPFFLQFQNACRRQKMKCDLEDAGEYVPRAPGDINQVTYA